MKTYEYTLTAVFWFFGNGWGVGCWRSLILTHSELWYACRQQPTTQRQNQDPRHTGRPHIVTTMCISGWTAPAGDEEVSAFRQRQAACRNEQQDGADLSWPSDGFSSGLLPNEPPSLLLPSQRNSFPTPHVDAPGGRNPLFVGGESPPPRGSSCAGVSAIAHCFHSS